MRISDWSSDVCSSDLARCIPVPEREFEPDAVTLEEEALERARAQVAARWGATLAVEGENLRIEQDPAQYPGGPHPDEAGTVLEIGALNGDLRVRSEEHTAEIQSLMRISYAASRLTK